MEEILRGRSGPRLAARVGTGRAARAPAFGFANAYQLPPDCLFVREVGGSWTVEAGRLLTNERAPLNLSYTRAVTNPAAFDPLFAETLERLDVVSA